MHNSVLTLFTIFLSIHYIVGQNVPLIGDFPIDRQSPCFDLSQQINKIEDSNWNLNLFKEKKSSYLINENYNFLTTNELPVVQVLRLDLKKCIQKSLYFKHILHQDEKDKFLFNTIKQDFNGIFGFNKSKITKYKSGKLLFFDWPLLDSSKHQLVGKIKKFYNYDYGDEHDWNLVVQPNLGFQFLSKQKTIEIEAMVNENIRKKNWFEPKMEVGFYGSWVHDRSHFFETKYELHPCELIWFSNVKNNDNIRKYKIMNLQNIDKRFNYFTNVQVGIFSIAFELDPSKDTPTIFIIHTEHENGLISTENEMDISDNPYLIINDKKVLEIRTKDTDLANISIQIVHVKVNESGNITGFVQFSSTVSDPIKGGYHIYTIDIKDNIPYINDTNSKLQLKFDDYTLSHW